MIIPPSLPYTNELIFDLILKEIKDLKRIFGVEETVEFRYWESAPLKYFDETKGQLQIKDLTKMLKAVEKTGAITIVVEANSLKGQVWTDEDEQFRYRMPSSFVTERLNNRAHYDIIIHDSFDEYYKEKKVGESNYGLMKNSEPVEVEVKENQVSFKEPREEYFIEYKNRVIMLNGKIEIGRPQLERSSEIIFDFLYKNPNKKFTKSQLEEELGIKIENTFSKVVERLGFKRGLKQAFFNLNKTTIEFKNPTKM